MCELLGVSACRRVRVDGVLKELAAHGVMHPHGWGMAVFYGDAVSLEKEPVPSFQSTYLQSRLQHPFEVQNMIAHIRLATCGSMAYENCHPFVHRDRGGRAWTLAHNGTIFHSPLLDGYKPVQEGLTDSERILCHVIHEINALEEAVHGKASPSERFHMMDRVVLDIAEHNKVNLLAYDGEMLYVHTNMRGTLFYSQREGATLFATVPLDEGDWQPVPFMQLLAYRGGERLFEGTKHAFEYRPGQEQPVQYDFAAL